LAAGALIAPGMASAAKQSYAPSQQARDFNGGAGGWTATDTSSGTVPLCVVAGVLVCPSSTSEHQATGGVDDSGHLNAHFEALVGVAGTATSVWESKPFKYRGVKGKKANSLTFKAKRNTALAQLLALPDASAAYAAEIVPAGSGAPIAAGSGDLPATEDWTAVEPHSISPGALKKGKKYSIRISSEYETGLVGLAASGDVGYDNVVLVAKRGGGGGGNKFKRQVAKGVGPAVHQGKYLYVRVKCPKSAQPNNCSFRTTATLKRKRPRIAGPKSATAAPRAKGYMKLKVKSGARKKLAKRNRVWAHVKVTAGSKKAKINKRVRVKR